MSDGLQLVGNLGSDPGLQGFSVTTWLPRELDVH